MEVYVKTSKTQALDKLAESLFNSKSSVAVNVQDKSFSEVRDMIPTLQSVTKIIKEGGDK